MIFIIRQSLQRRDSMLEMNLRPFRSINGSRERKGGLKKIIKAFKYTLGHEVINGLENAVH